MNRILLASTFLLSLAGTAMAADALTEAAPAAYDWSGVYIGANVGGGFGKYTQFDATGDGVDVDVDGFVGGVSVGYNWQFGSIVAGVEADISNGPRGITDRGTQGPFWSCNSGDCNAKIDYFGTVRGRLGVTMDRALIYATGGFAYGRTSGGIENSVQQGSGNVSGYAVGAGLNYAFTKNWIATGEFLHVDLGDLKFGTGIGSNRFLGRGSFNTVRVGFAYKF